MARKPPKPYAEFPLYAHAGGVWAKKIKGKVHYFGPWSDPTAALENFLEQRDYLLAGRTPPAPRRTVANLLDEFMDEKKAHLETDDIGEATFKEYEATCEVIHGHFGKHRPADGLTVEDFNSLRQALAKAKRKGKVALAPVTFKRRLTIARMVFAGQPLKFRKALKAPPQRLIRAQNRNRDRRLYEAADIRKLVKAADPHLRAMILLGINCGFGPKDCYTLPASAVDFKSGWHTYARPKTEVERRSPLWIETVKALKAVAGKLRVFEGDWDRWIVGREFDKLCTASKVRNHGFYSLRRTFETIATTADVSQAVIDGIMGHARNDMASVYRQKIFDDLLRKCTDHVRQWYLGKVIIH